LDTLIEQFVRERPACLQTLCPCRRASAPTKQRPLKALLERFLLTKIRLVDMQVCLLSPTCLIPTEEVDPDRVAELEAQILRAGCWTVPITAEKEALCVMDGHHRLAVAHRLKLPIVPVMLLDYNAVRVESWRPGLTVTPACILAMARSGRKFPCKTTRHIFDQSLPNCILPLESLRHLAPTERAVAYAKRARS
jgi:hypothetical protein